MAIRARVSGGRIRVDEPVDLPEGREVELAVIDLGDDLADEDRARLHAALDAALARLSTGHPGLAPDEVLARLRARST